ncbi:hypothetical protein P4O66_015578, partial [Electrophorus voltai]
MKCLVQETKVQSTGPEPGARNHPTEPSPSMLLKWHRSRGRGRAFITNPFGFAKHMLGDKRSGHLDCSREGVNCFLQNTLSDLLREQELESNKALISPAPPTTEFNLREPNLKEVEEVIERSFSIHSKPQRYSAAIQKSNDELGACLTKVDKSGLPGRFKAWLYQHSILPRVLWPLLVYEVPLTTVDSLERKISSFLQKWLGLPQSLTSAALYGTSNILQLPFSGLTEEFKVAHTREVLQHRDSRDCKVSSAGTEVRTGRKWQAEKEVEVVESRVRQKALVGSLVMGRVGLGYFPKPQVSKAQGKERHHLLQEKIRAGVEEEQVSRVVGLRPQGAWTRCENTLQRRISWSNIMQADLHRVRFLVQVVYDALPSPANLHAWGKIETSTCLLCSRRGSLEHLLSSCPKAIADGCYQWHHDQVLKSIALAISISKHHHAQKKVITFIKAGDKPQARPRTTMGLFHTASDWQLQVHLGRQLKFPQHIAKTSFRPDMIITSAASKQLIMLELSVPWEERMEEANGRKRAKYQILLEMCRGLRTSYEPIEVDYRGF